MESDRMLEEVRKAGLVPPGEPVVALLSGGRDSVCLLDLLIRVLGPGEVVALHVNYGLRDDSDEDEHRCAQLCELLGARLEVEHPRRPEGPGNLQSWARDIRYAAAARLALPNGARIASGQTADDQVETILYRLASSPESTCVVGDAAQGRTAGATAAQFHPPPRQPPTVSAGASSGTTIHPTTSPHMRATEFGMD